MPEQPVIPAPPIIQPVVEVEVTPFQQKMKDALKEPELTVEEKAKLEEQKKQKELKEQEEVKKREEQKKLEESQKKSQQPLEAETSKVEAEKTVEELKQLRTRVAEYDKDPFGAVKKYHPQVLDNMEAARDLDGFLAKWQQTALIQDLKKKFPDKVDDGWTFDVGEAYQAGTPSYTYRVATEEKRQEITSLLKGQKAREEAVVSQYAKQRDEDVKFIKESCGLTDEQLKAQLEKFDSLHQQVFEGKLTPDKHPFALRNLYRGVYFDELVAVEKQKATELAVNQLKEMYKEKGIILPELKPTDGSGKPETSLPPVSGAEKKKSPMAAQMEKYAV
jgi:hypothetical protein